MKVMLVVTISVSACREVRISLCICPKTKSVCCMVWLCNYKEDLHDHINTVVVLHVCGSAAIRKSYMIKSTAKHAHRLIGMESAYKAGQQHNKGEYPL